MPGTGQLLSNCGKICCVSSGQPQVPSDQFLPADRLITATVIITKSRKHIGIKRNSVHDITLRKSVKSKYVFKLGYLD